MDWSSKNKDVNRVLISVIIPIYGVEKYIEKCVRSLFDQTLKDIEFIFVNDCTRDRSIDILEKLIKEYGYEERIKIIHHSTNLGLPAARNSGLKEANGIYIFHCDSDDFLELDALEQFYMTAIKDNADIVWSDFYLSFEKNERYMSQNPKYLNFEDNPYLLLKLMLGGNLKYNVWNKLIKKSIYTDNNLIFPEGRGMGEDMTIIKCFVHANKLSYLPQATYHYVQLNSGAYTKSLNGVKLKQIRENVEDLENYILNLSDEDLSNYIHYFKLSVKLPFLISEDTDSYKLWNKWFSESNRYINDHPSFDFRTRLIQKVALHKQYWLLKFYNITIIRFIYGVIYR